MTPELSHDYNQINIIDKIQNEIEESPTFGPLILTERFGIKTEKFIPPEYQTDQEIIGLLHHQDNTTTLYMSKNLDFVQRREVVLKSVFRYLRIKEKSPQENFFSKIYPYKSPLTPPKEYLYDIEAIRKFILPEKRIKNAFQGNYNSRGNIIEIAEKLIASPEMVQERLVELDLLPPPESFI